MSANDKPSSSNATDKPPSSPSLAGQKRCKTRACKKVFSSLDPHERCTKCTPRVCIQTEPCDQCSVLSPTDWKAWKDQAKRSVPYVPKTKTGDVTPQKGSSVVSQSPSQVGSSPGENRLDNLEKQFSGMQSFLLEIRDSLRGIPPPPPPPEVESSASSSGQFTGPTSGQLTGQTLPGQPSAGSDGGGSWLNNQPPALSSGLPVPVLPASGLVNPVQYPLSPSIRVESMDTNEPGQGDIDSSATGHRPGSSEYVSANGTINTPVDEIPPPPPLQSNFPAILQPVTNRVTNTGLSGNQTGGVVTTTVTTINSSNHSAMASASASASASGYQGGGITTTTTGSHLGSYMGPPITSPPVVGYQFPAFSGYGQHTVAPPPGFIPQGYQIPRVGQNVSQATNGTQYQQAMGSNLPSVADALRSLQNAGLIVQEPGSSMFSGVEVPAPDYEVGLRHGDYTSLDDAIPLSSLQNDVRARFPDLIASPVTQVTEPSSLGVTIFQQARPEKMVNLPLHPTIPQWLERHSLILEGRSGNRGSKPYTGKNLPKAPVLRSSRFLPSDTPQLLDPLQVPAGWHRLVSEQNKPSPASINLSMKDYQDLMMQSQRDLAIISDLDWLLAGGTSLSTQMTSLPQEALHNANTLLQRYLQEISRSLEVLERHSTARYASLNWRLRDSFLNRLHPSVNQITKDQLRRSSLNDDYLFAEGLVDRTAEVLKGDVMLATNTQSLQNFSRKPQTSRGGKRPASGPSHHFGPKQAKPNPQPFQGASRTGSGQNPGGRGVRGPSGGDRGGKGYTGKKGRGRGSTQ